MQSVQSRCFAQSCQKISRKYDQLQMRMYQQHKNSTLVTNRSTTASAQMKMISGIARSKTHTHTHTMGVSDGVRQFTNLEQLSPSRQETISGKRDTSYGRWFCNGVQIRCCGVSLQNGIVNLGCRSEITRLVLGAGRGRNINCKLTKKSWLSFLLIKNNKLTCPILYFCCKCIIVRNILDNITNDY